MGISLVTAWLINFDAGCMEAGIHCKSGGPLSSTHVLKKPTAVALVTRLWDNLPKSWGIFDLSTGEMQV